MDFQNTFLVSLQTSCGIGSGPIKPAMHRRTDRFARTVFSVLAIALAVVFAPAAKAQNFTCSPPAPNQIVCENSLPGNPPSDWAIEEDGDSTIQGFATDISVNQGGTISFKIDTDAKAYTIGIFRMGYYAGLGARKIASITPSATLPQAQPACMTVSATNLYDCGNWAISASWQVPADATSGIYFAVLTRTDTGGVSQIFFIVRNDTSHSDILYQTSDETWQAYNSYGGHSVYGQLETFDLPNRAFKVSYNRPFITRSFSDESATWVFGSEYPMVRWLEANGYDVTYSTGVDAARNGSLIQNHKLYMDCGHDEYVSGPQRTNIEAARDAGVNMAFFSGNEFFWKTRWENSIDGTNTANRTMVVYKETLAFAKIDPDDPPTWTGTWRDPSFSPPADGGRPENALTGTIFMVNGPGTDNPGNLSIQVPAAEGKMRFWRNTTIANLTSGQTATLPAGTLGYEWDEDLDNGARPAGTFDLSTATYSLTSDFLLDYGATYGAGSATHQMTMHRAPSGALIFGAGTVQWAWGLDSNHDNPFYFPNLAPDPDMQQATVNLFADMGVQPASIQGGLLLATKSNDTTPPLSTITSPTNGSTQPLGVPLTISGTAKDSGSGVIGGVEVSVDGGGTWHPANGRESWSYSWTPLVGGSVNILSRAVNDSAYLETPSSGITISIPKPPINPDVNTSADTSSASTTIKSPTFSTAAGNELLLAFVTGDYLGGTNTTVTGVSGGGLTWALAVRANAQDGTSEVWRAFATAPLSGVAVTATLSQSVLSSITVKSFTGMDTSGTNGSGAIGATKSASATSGAPTATLTTTRSSSWVYGVGNDFDNAIARTPGPNQTIVHQDLTTTGDTYWVQQQNQPTPVSGTSVTINDTAPTGDRYNLAIVEILASAGPPPPTYTISGTVSGAVVSGVTVNLTGTSSGTATTDGSGNFTFAGLNNGSYTVTPSKAGFTFTPTSLPATVNNASVPSINFTSQAVPPPPVAIGTTTLPNAIQNQPYSATLNATGGSSPYTWSLVNSTVLPQGLTLSATGQITGTPTVVGTTTFTVQVADSGTPQQTATQQLSIVVTSPPAFVTIWSPSAVPGTIDVGGGTNCGACTLVQGTNSGGSGVSDPTSYVNPTTTGDLLIVFGAHSGWTGSGTTTISDSLGNTWHACNGTGSGVFTDIKVDGSNGMSCHYAVNITGAAVDTVTISASDCVGGCSFVAGSYLEYSGVASTASAAWDAYGFNASATSTTGSNNSTCGSVTTTEVNDLVICGIDQITGTLSAGTSPVNFGSLDQPGIVAAVEHVVWPSGGVINPTMTNSLSGATYGGITLALKGSSAGGSAAELGVKFKSDVNGTITGIRFYKSSNNTGTHIGNLWSSSGTLLSTATFTNETASGWQQVTFSPAVPITANTVYVASYHTNVGHYSDDQNYFSNSGVDNPPLHALQNGVSGVNGVIAPGSTSSFPSTGSNSSNYWVDVVFVPAATLTAITVTPSNPSIQAGNTQPFTATGTYSDNSTQNITAQVSWSSSITGVATINSSGVASGVATGSSIITATQGSISGNTTLKVQPASLVITTTTLPNAVENQAYTATLAASGGTPPYTWSLANSTTLPPGLTLTGGQITGTPTSTGTTAFTVKATDSGSPAQIATQSLSLTVNASGCPCSIAGSITGTGGNAATVTLSGAGSATVTADASGNYIFNGLANGSYTVTPSHGGFIFSPSSLGVTLAGANKTGANFSSTAQLAIDQTVSTDRSTAATTIASPTFSTTKPNELLLAFIATDATAANITVKGVTGAGLTWTLVKRTNTQFGTSEIWRALSSTALSSVSVTATLSQSVAASITMVTFTGVDSSGTGGSGAIGNTGSGNANPGAPTAQLTTTRNNSWVFGVGNDYDNAIARTPGPNQTVFHQYFSTLGDTYWFQRQNATTPASGTVATINDTAPTTDRYNLSICEILPAP